MSKFNVGDKVRCISNDTGMQSSLTVGKIYTVIESEYRHPSLVTVKLDNGNAGGAFCTRFVKVEEAPQQDKVNPKHYNYPIQPITYIRMLGLNFNRGCIVKYASRAGHKSGEDAIDDLKKIIRYAEAEIKAVEIERGKGEWKDGI